MATKAKGSEKEHDDEHDDDDDDDDQGGRTFTQEEVDRIASKARRSAKNSAVADLLKALGVEDLDEASELVQQARKSVEKGKEKSKPSSKKDDEDDDPLEDFRQEVKEQIKNLQKANKAEIEALKLTSKVEKALMQAGMSVRAAEKAAKLVEIEAGADDDDIKSAVEDLKETMPQLFPEEDSDGEDDDESDDRRAGPKRKDDKRKDPPRSNPGSAPRRRKAGDPRSAARTLLLERHPRLNDKN